ncbi:MAG: CotH kinase family protein [Chitinophagales bacterium]
MNRLFFCICTFFLYVPLLAQVSFTSSNLPIVLIDTDDQQILDASRIVASMQIIYNGEDKLSSIEDPANVYNGRISIEYRGSSSQSYPKKSFGLETQLSNGDNNNVSLLGMPEENDWILYAPYADKSLMRNVLAYYIANSMGEYAARTRFCELVINGNYQGVYVLMEKLKRDKNRIDIAKLDPDEIEGDDLTGGYIFKIDKQTGSGGDGWFSTYTPPYNSYQKIFFQYEYPESETIVPEQAAYIEDFMHAFEDNLQSEDFADSLKGYRQYIDTDSFIDYMIVNEVCKNIDAYRLSTFLYKDKDSNGGKLHIGPVWDFNFSAGNINYCQGELTTGWVLDFNQICTDDFWLIPFWWEKLRQDNAFNQQSYQRWQQLRQTVLSADKLLSWITEQETFLHKAQIRNFSKWQILDEYIWPNNYVGGDYSSEIAYLKNWLSDRLDWLDSAFEELASPNSANILGVEVVKVTPNPFNESLQWTYRAVKGDVILIELLDMTGKKMGEWSIVCEHTGQNTATWKQSATILSEGLYVYHFSINQNEVKRELILKY